MKSIILAAYLTTLGLFACQSEQKQTPSNDDIIAARKSEDNPNKAIHENGKTLFQSNCAACHNPIKDLTGPALKGALARVPSKEWLYKWVKNPAQVLAAGDKYAQEIYEKWNKTAMTAFPTLSQSDIDDIMAYVESFE